MTTPTLTAKGNKLKGLLTKCEQFLNAKKEGTMTIKVPRYDLKDDDNTCTFHGVPCQIVTKNTCCVLIEIPVSELYRELSKLKS